MVINALYTLYYEAACVRANILLVKTCIYLGFDLIFVHILPCVERGSVEQCIMG